MFIQLLEKIALAILAMVKVFKGESVQEDSSEPEMSEGEKLYNEVCRKHNETIVAYQRYFVTRTIELVDYYEKSSRAVQGCGLEDIFEDILKKIQGRNFYEMLLLIENAKLSDKIIKMIDDSAYKRADSIDYSVDTYDYKCHMYFINMMLIKGLKAVNREDEYVPYYITKEEAKMLLLFYYFQINRKVTNLVTFINYSLINFINLSISLSDNSFASFASFSKEPFLCNLVK